MQPTRAPQRAWPDWLRPSEWPTPVRGAAWTVLALGLAWVAAHSFANREASLAQLRDRAESTLRRRLGAVELGQEVSVDWLFRATVGPVVLPASRADLPPVVRVERVKVRASFPALLSGRVVPASVKLFDVEVAPGAGGRELSALVERIRGARRPADSPEPASEAAADAADPVLHLRRVTLVLPGDRRVGPVDARVERERGGGEEVVRGVLALHGGGKVEAVFRREVGATATGTGTSAATPTRTATSTATPTATPTGKPAPPASWTLTLDAHASPADLPDFLRHLAVQARRGELAFHVEAAAAPAGAIASLRGTLTGLTLEGEPLGAEPIGPLAAEGQAEFAWRAAERRLVVSRAVLRPVGPLALEVVGAVSFAGDLPFEVDLRVPPVDYRSLVDALPSALAPGPGAPRPAGSFGAAFKASGALRRPAGWAISGGLDLAALRETARQAPPVPLRSTFTARPAGEDGPAILVGPENPAFVPIGELPEHVVRAVTMSEDAGFFGHAGFDFDELKNAAVAGAAAGKLGRGGSTITQQLAKNLFLSRDRTLARKAREALIAVALEGTVPKARLLEIYLNVIEWGPGLHGIGPAASHYFDVDARALTPRQACFLAAIVPSPLRSHAAVAAGRPASLWADRVDTLLLKLQQVGVLTEDQLVEALAEPLAFRGGGASQGGGEVAAPRPDADGEQGLDEPDAEPGWVPEGAAPSERAGAASAGDGG